LSHTQKNTFVASKPWQAVDAKVVSCTLTHL